MKTTDEFWNVVAQYNSATAMVQTIVFPIGVILVVLLYIRRSALFGALMKGYLGLVFAFLAIYFFRIGSPRAANLYFDEQGCLHDFKFSQLHTAIHRLF